MSTGYRYLKPSIFAVVLTRLLVAAGPLRAQSVTFQGRITSMAGTGTAGYTGEGGPAISADLNAPQGAAVDGAGNLFDADSSNSRVRVVNTQAASATVVGVTIGAGDIATVAGTVYAGHTSERRRCCITWSLTPSAPPLPFTKTAASAGWAAAVVPGPCIRNPD